jgi:hypothetical protein
LSVDRVALFRRATAGKLGDVRILSRTDGEAWGKSHQHRPLREACKTGKIVPTASFLSSATPMPAIMAGVPLQVVGANLGHADTRMTERHDAHLAPS